MDIRPVLIEKEDKTSSSVISSSGILIEKKYVLTTSNILTSALQKYWELVENITAGKLHLYKGKNVFKFRAIWKNDNDALLTSKEANIFGLIKCKNIETFCKYNFKDWSVDFKENNLNVKNLLSVFVLFVIENEPVHEDELKALLHAWLLHINSASLHKGDRIICKSTPFGTRDFLNSLSEGVISNRLNSFLLLSDCSSTPGCEGGLVSSMKNPAYPIGIIVSSLNWWRKDWSGFTLIANIKPIICQIIDLDLVHSDQNLNSLNRVLVTSEKSLAQINCGADWGTCILLSKDQGIFLTNSHVVRHGLNIRIFWKDTMVPAFLIYKTPYESIFDLAIVKCNTNVSMSACDITAATYKFGDTVYCAGYPLLSTLSKPEGVTITRGIISDCNPYMIKTTCGVYPGFSGGAVLNSEGTLLGIIVCNTRLTDIDVTYPKFNMAISYGAVSDVISEYIKYKDHNILTQLQSSNYEAIKMWMRLEGKL